MLKTILTSTLLITLCLGCDTAVNQQQREDARKKEVSENLKKIGEEMHAKQDGQSLPEGPAKDNPTTPDPNVETPAAPSNASDAGTKPAQ